MLTKHLNGTIEKTKNGYCARKNYPFDSKIFKTFEEAYKYLNN